ncbi:MAG: class I SAM-dependent methyltransferase [Bacillota bacterium]
MENTNTRWVLAQEYEKKWWDQRSSTIDFEFYRHFASELQEFSKDEISINKDTVILEIGSGAGGILTYLKQTDNRYAIDPLEDFYSTVQKFTEQRDKAVKYISSKGENLPFENKMFDLVIMDNVLDHCDDPAKVMQEVKRVLKNNGIVYFKQNTYHIWGKMVRSLMEKLVIDKGHPHTFSKSHLISLVGSNGLKIVKSKHAGYYPTWKKEFSSGSLKDKLKAVLFVTRDKVTYLIKNASVG